MTTLTPQATDLKAVLHVGCGMPNPNKLHKTFQTPQWREIRLDIDAAAQPDILCDMVDMHPVANNSVDAVWSSHNLEHLYAHQVPRALAEFYRVLKPGGMALLTMPDLEVVARIIAAGKLDEVLYKSPAGPVYPLDIIYGYGPLIAKGKEYMAHRTGFSGNTLKNHLQAVGFTRIDVKTIQYDLWAVAYK